MAGLGVVGFVAMVTCSFATGARLLWIWRRSRHLPELTIGTACVASTLGGLLMLASGRLAVGAFPASALAQLLLNAAVVAMALGLWRIFRPARRWPLVVCALLGATLFATWVAVLLPGRPIHPTDSSPANLLMRFARIAPYLWASFECLHYHRKLRRRLPLGLADPVAAHQILLWGVSAAGMAAILGLAMFCGLAFGTSILAWPPGLLATSALGFVSGVSLWCAFFPPAPYRRLLQARAAAVEA